MPLTLAVTIRSLAGPRRRWREEISALAEPIPRSGNLH